ncbi:MAG: hypothetical protein WAO52_20725, partial [Prolixibacteraceae bacterium]
IEPTQAGNGGYATITVFGGALTVANTSLSLRRTGESDVVGEKLWSPKLGSLAAYFNLNGKSIGKWDLVVKQNGVEQVLAEAISIIKAELPDPWVSVSGRGLILFNMWQTYAINYGNNGNVDALGVPLNLVISDLPGMDIEFIDFKIGASEYIKENFPQIVELMDTLYAIIPDYFGPGLDARYYPLYLPLVESNSSQSLHIRIKSPGDFKLETWVTAPMFAPNTTTTKSAGGTNDDWPDDKTKLNACIALAAADAASSSLMDFVGMVLPVDCVYDFATLAFNPWDKMKPDHEQSAFMPSFSYNLASAVISCVGDLTPVKAIKIGIKITSIVNNMYKAYLADQDCRNAFDPKYKSKRSIHAVDSFDPNEMIGPPGFGENNYIQKTSMMPYTILFENKSTATAPAHLVTISDTLDLSKFDLKEFGFGSFGFGDTILVPNGNKLKEFSMDVDLNPKMNLITRVSGKLDTISGVITWEFISLNPTEMRLEEDPMIGFLPPNNANHAGEGFVSFSVGLKKELGTNDVLKNMASIVFDANKPILTNEFVNTLDLDKPESQVYALDATTDSRFPVAWTGTDNGSGIASYSIYVMENDTSLQVWKQNTTLVTDEFIGNVGSKYKFYSIATDNVSLIESTPGEYDASTHITVHVEEFELKKNELQVFPNPVKDKMTVS